MDNIEAIFLYKWERNDPVLLTNAFRVQSKFKQDAPQQLLSFSARTIAGRLEPGTRVTIPLDAKIGFVCHTWVAVDNLAGVLVTKKDYPA